MSSSARARALALNGIMKNGHMRVASVERPSDDPPPPFETDVASELRQRYAMCGLDWMTALRHPSKCVLQARDAVSRPTLLTSVCIASRQDALFRSLPLLRHSLLDSGARGAHPGVRDPIARGNPRPKTHFNTQ